MVLEAYRAESMTNPLYVWGVDYEQPEVQLIWSRNQPPKADATTSDQPSPEGTRLAIRPKLADCDVVEVYMNDLSFPLKGADASIQHWTIEADAAVLPDERYPDCALLVTYRRRAPPEDLVLVAATRDGVVAEFPSGRRKPAWLLLTPLSVISDTVLVASILSWPWLYLLGN